MKTSINCLLLALALTFPALAHALKIPEDKPVASIAFPEDWTASVAGDMITASNEDGDVLTVILTRQTCRPFKRQGGALLK